MANPSSLGDLSRAGDGDASGSRSPSARDGSTVLDFARPRSGRLDRSDELPPDTGDADVLGLMERVRNGDVKAFERILDRFWTGTLLYALQLVGDHDTADDLAQEAFARLWQGRAAWRGEGSVRHWLLRTTRRLFVSHQRRSRVRAKWVASADAQAAPGPRTPLHEVETEELRAAIHEAVRTLPPRRREAFALVFLEGLSNQEAAQIMEVQPQTVANYLQGAFADLRALLKPHFPSF